MPRQYSTGGRQRLGAKTKTGERSLQRRLIIGADSDIKGHVHASAWLGGMLAGMPTMRVRVALANSER